VAGRFGNSGQTDYSAANDLLCKIASAVRNQYPGIKAVAIDWSAWGGVGMATRGNIPTLMKMAGIDMVPPEQAAPMVRAELLAGTGEAVIAGSLGALLGARCPHGGMDLAKADHALRAGQPIHPMLSHVADFDLNRGLTLEAELDPKTQPFLYDHAMDGTPILPGVMGIEGFSVAARHISSVLASGKGGFEVSRLEDILFLAAFKFYRNAPGHLDGVWGARASRVGGLRDPGINARPQYPLRRAHAALQRQGLSGTAGDGRRRDQDPGAQVERQLYRPGRRHLPTILPRPGLPGAGGRAALRGYSPRKIEQEIAIDCQR
jgi:hypothetical protein